MNNISHILIPALVSLPIVISGSQEKEPEYEFIQGDTYYSFRGSFYVKGESDCLINLIYDFNNLIEYTLGAQSIKVIQQGENWYDVSYTYRKFLVFENVSTWRRRLNQSKHEISFEMLSTRNSLNMMPDVIASTGHYQIIQEKDLCRVEYFQECTLESGFLKRAYLNEAKQKAIEFLHGFKTYLERKCE